MPRTATGERTWMDAAEAADYLGYGPDWLKHLARLGVIPGIKTKPSKQGQWRFRRTDLDAYLERNRVGATRPSRRKSA